MAEEIINSPCFKCKVPIYITASVDRYLRSTRATFYCINGHPQAYSEQPSEADKLRKQLEEERRMRQRAERNVAMWADDAKAAREMAEHERRRANGYKGHATRITKRAKAGICPCCNRHFTALERHMATKHPEFTPLELEGDTTDEGKVRHG